MSRFEPTPDELKKSLAWHSAITSELQRRVREAEIYVRAYRNDPELLRILAGRDNGDNR